jgi:hypothetical protein
VTPVTIPSTRGVTRSAVAGTRPVTVEVSEETVRSPLIRALVAVFVALALLVPGVAVLGTDVVGVVFAFADFAFACVVLAGVVFAGLVFAGGAFAGMVFGVLATGSDGFVEVAGRGLEALGATAFVTGAVT